MRAPQSPDHFWISLDAADAVGTAKSSSSLWSCAASNGERGADSSPDVYDLNGSIDEFHTDGREVTLRLPVRLIWRRRGRWQSSWIGPLQASTMMYGELGRRHVLRLGRLARVVGCSCALEAQGLRLAVAEPTRSATRVFDWRACSASFSRPNEPKSERVDMAERLSGSAEQFCPSLFARRGRDPFPSDGRSPQRLSAPPALGVELVANVWRCRALGVDLDTQVATLARRDGGCRIGVHDGVCRQLGHDQLRVGGDSVEAGWPATRPARGERGWASLRPGRLRTASSRRLQTRPPSSSTWRRAGELSWRWFHPGRGRGTSISWEVGGAVRVGDVGCAYPRVRDRCGHCRRLGRGAPRGEDH